MDIYIYIRIYILMCICIYVIYIGMYIYIYTEEGAQKRRLWGLRFGNPLFSVVLYVSKGCAWVSVSSWSLVWCACVHVFVSNYNIGSGLFQTRRSVYKHRVCL